LAIYILLKKALKASIEIQGNTEKNLQNTKSYRVMKHLV